MFPKKVYIYFVYMQIKLVDIEKKLIYYKFCSRFIIRLKIKNITQILFIKFIWIIVIASQVRQEMFMLDVGSDLSVPDPSFSDVGLGSWVSCN